MNKNVVIVALIFLAIIESAVITLFWKTWNISSQISLPSYSFNTIQGSVFASGSWIVDRPADSDDDFAAETIYLICHPESRICEETQAFITKGSSPWSSSLGGITISYDVISWTNNELVAQIDGRAAVIKLVIDFGHQTVTKEIREKAEIESSAPLPFIYHLGDGIEYLNGKRR